LTKSQHGLTVFSDFTEIARFCERHCEFAKTFVRHLWCSQTGLTITNDSHLTHTSLTNSKNSSQMTTKLFSNIALFAAQETDEKMPILIVDGGASSNSKAFVAHSGGSCSSAACGSTVRRRRLISTEQRQLVSVERRRRRLEHGTTAQARSGSSGSTARRHLISADRPQKVPPRKPSVCKLRCKPSKPAFAMLQAAACFFGR